MCGRLASAEPRQWPVEFKSGRYEIHADFDVSNQAGMLQEFSALSGDIEDVLGISLGEKPVHVVLFESATEYRRYMSAYFPDLPQRRAIFLQDRGPGMLFAHWHVDVATDLRHEITHALLNDGPEPLPLWLDEGLAEYFEAARWERYDRNAHLSDVVQRASQGLVPSLKQLEDVSDFLQFKQTHYRDSWSWVHFLIHRSASTRRLLAKYLREHRSGSTQPAISRQLHQACNDFTQEYQAHFQNFQ